jgi:hypothetical protein
MKTKADTNTFKITMDLAALEEAGLHVNVGLNALEIMVDTQYDQEFVDFLDNMPAHLSYNEKDKLSAMIDRSYTSILVERAFNVAAIPNRGDGHAEP